MASSLIVTISSAGHLDNSMRVALEGGVSTRQNIEIQIWGNVGHILKRKATGAKTGARLEREIQRERINSAVASLCCFWALRCVLFGSYRFQDSEEI